MKKFLHIALTLFLTFTFINSNARNNVEAYLNYCTFYSPQAGPYIETYLSVIGNSLKQEVLPGNKLQAKIEVTMIFRQGEKVFDYKKFILSGPEVSDSLASYPNFVDQQRFSLENGSYEFDLEIRDLNNKNAESLSVVEQINLKYTPSDLIFSDIQLVESYQKTTATNILTKSGYDLVPYVSYFYPKSMKNLTFYAEFYNSLNVIPEEEKFLINYYLERAETRKKIDNYNSFSRKNVEDVTIVFGDFPIEKLPTGNYNLVIEARNRNNELLAEQKLFFQRSNNGVDLNPEELATLKVETSFVSKYTNADTLSDFIRSLRPISTNLERTFADNQLKQADHELKQQFFYNFWASRDPVNPEKAWMEYYDNVKKVNKAFGGRLKKGYDTDRGRVYLQYGAPNTISQQYNEPSAYPYEIWHYYHIGNFNNRRFIFYNPDLGTNDFPLLHSDMFGEINNPRWQLMLHSRDHQVLDLDEQRYDQHFGGNAEDFWQNPR